MIRAREDLAADVVGSASAPTQTIIADEWIMLRVRDTSKFYPVRLRRIRFFDAVLNRHFTFLSNAEHLFPEEIASVYKKRWQIELFFKWLKQHLKVKLFWGNDRNALLIQIYVAIITYSVISIIKSELKINRSLYEMLQILSASLTDKTPLKNYWCPGKVFFDKKTKG